MELVMLFTSVTLSSPNIDRCSRFIINIFFLPIQKNTTYILLIFELQSHAFFCTAKTIREYLIANYHNLEIMAAKNEYNLRLLKFFLNYFRYLKGTEVFDNVVTDWSTQNNIFFQKLAG